MGMQRLRLRVNAGKDIIRDSKTPKWPRNSRARILYDAFVDVIARIDPAAQPG